jgi:hypothetical protein
MVDSHRRRQMDNLFSSFNLRGIITFPTRTGSNTDTAIDNIFLDSHYYDKYDIFPVMNGLSDHDAKLLTLSPFLNSEDFLTVW